MEKIVNINFKKIYSKYKYTAILILIIFILFLILGYSNFEQKFLLILNDEKVKLSHEIYTKSNEQYIHIDDLTDVFSENIYNDKIAGKLIITSYDTLVKINYNDTDYIVKQEDNTYCNLEKILSHIDYNVVVSKNKIYVLYNKYIKGEVKNNRVEVYDKTNSNILCYLDKQSNVAIYLDSNFNDTSKKMVNIVVSINGRQYYGKVLKQNLDFEYEQQQEENSNKKVILVKADKELKENTDVRYVDLVAINMYRLSNVNSLTRLDYSNNTYEGADVLATIDNNQKSSNYDMDIVTRMLNSEGNRYEIIQQILKGTDNIAGVNLNFENFKVSDKDNYTQFVKELAAVMHSNNKIISVNIPSTQYIDVKTISNVVDYIVIQPYADRTLSSKTSGPISSIPYVEGWIKNILAESIPSNKIIVEIPAYTILWTERRGTVINAERYNMTIMAQYIKENKIDVISDVVSGQNYINYTKGITTYKMWLEDEYSLTKKAQLAKVYNLAGVSIYMSGMEIKSVYNSIFKCITE